MTAKTEEELEPAHYAGAAAIGFGVSGILWAAIGQGWIVYLAWMVIGAALIAACRITSRGPCSRSATAWATSPCCRSWPR